ALVEILDGSGEKSRAYEELLDLAPLDHPGHFESQMWLAQRLLEGKTGRPRALTEAESHLNQALRARPASQKAHALLGELYVAVNRHEAARPHLERVVHETPGLRNLLAEVYLSLGRREDARNEARTARDYFRSRLLQDPQDRQAALQVATSSV